MVNVWFFYTSFMDPIKSMGLDYLATLGEKWPHSRGNVVIPYMDPLGMVRETRQSSDI